MDTVTLSNGLKALFGTSQSTATNIPTCAADGTPAGNISVANLASVLGVGTMEYNTALADCNAPQKYVQYVTVNTANIPDSLVDSGYLINISPLPESSPDYGFYSFQLLYAYTNGNYYIRCSRRVSGGISWTAWKQL